MLLGPSLSDQWLTPRWFAERLGPVQFDPAAHPLDHIQSQERYYGPVDLYEVEDFIPAEPAAGRGRFLDSLLPGSLWPVTSSGLLFCNPPYSNPLPWALRFRLLKEAGYPVAILLKDDRSTRWYQQVAGPGWMAGEFPFRLAFEDPTGQHTEVAKFPVVLVTNCHEVVKSFPVARWTVPSTNPIWSPDMKKPREPKLPRLVKVDGGCYFSDATEG